MSDDQRIIDDGDLRKYRTEIPNMADDDLDPYEYRLYAHYKRVGSCWESVRTTADKTKMSAGKVVSTRKALEEKGWIRTEQDKTGTIRVFVLDRWRDNFDRYSPPSAPIQRSSHEHDRSPGEPKKEPVKKEPKVVVPESDPTPEADTTTTATTNIFTVWEEEAKTTISSFLRDELGDMVDTFGFELAADAIREAVKSTGPGQFNVKYVWRILERWQREGKRERRPTQSSEPAPRRQKRLEPIVPQNYTPGPKAAAIMEEARRQLAEKQKAKAAS